MNVSLALVKHLALYQNAKVCGWKSHYELHIKDEANVDDIEQLRYLQQNITISKMILSYSFKCTALHTLIIFSRVKIIPQV